MKIDKGHIKAITGMLAADDASATKRHLISVKVALDKLGCRRTKFYELIRNGTIIAYKQGHQTLVDADSIDAYHGSLKRIEPRQGRAAS